MNQCSIMDQVDPVTSIHGDDHHLTQNVDEQHTKQLLTPPDHDRDKEVYDSGNYSETGAAGQFFNGYHDTDVGESSVSGSRFVTPVMSPVLSIGSPGLSRRGTATQEPRSDDDSSFTKNVTQTIPDPVISSTPKENKNTPYLQDLLDNFNTLYEQKLLEAESSASAEANDHDSDNSCLEVKNAIMSDWVRDLNEQNRVLIDTIDEMEKEAEEKIQLLQGKVQRSAQMLMEHMTVIQEYEKQVQSFVSHRDETERHLQLFYVEADDLLKKKNALEQKLETVEEEHASLIKLITRIRDWGVWDISGLNLNTKTYKHLFDLYPGLPGSEVQTVFTQDRARQVRETEAKLQELEQKFTNLEKGKSEADKSNSEKEKLILDLQKERTELHSKITSLEAENHDYHKRLEESHDLFTKSFLVSAKNGRDRELSDLVWDMRELKDELHVARTERESAKSEASALKTEMNQRLVDVTQIKGVLKSLYVDSQVTKDKVRSLLENQDKLASIQEEVKIFEEKCKEAETLFGSSSEMVKNLQEQLDILYDRVDKIEHQHRIPSSLLQNAVKSASRIRHSKEKVEPEAISSTNASPRDKHRPTSEALAHKPSWNAHFYSKKPPPTAIPLAAKIRAASSTNSPRPGVPPPRPSTPHPPKKIVTKPPPGDSVSKKSQKPPKPNVKEPQKSGTEKLPPIENSSARTTKIVKYFSDRFGLVLGQSSDQSSGKLSKKSSHHDGSFKLPELPPQLDGTSTPSVASGRKASIPEEYRFPKIVERGGAGQDAPQSGRTESSKPNRSEYEELEDLLGAALDSSRTLMSEFPEARTIRVRAARHYHNRHQETNRHPGPNHGKGQSSSGAGDEPTQVPKSVRDSGSFTETFGSMVAAKGSHPAVVQEKKKNRMVPPGSAAPGDSISGWTQNIDEVLASLPEQSHESVIQNWIKDTKKNLGKESKPTSSRHHHSEIVAQTKRTEPISDTNRNITKTTTSTQRKRQPNRKSLY